MPKTQRDSSSMPDLGRSGPPPLNAGIRRHLGLGLRTLYAGILSEPPGARIAALLARLDSPKR